MWFRLIRLAQTSQRRAFACVNVHGRQLFLGDDNQNRAALHRAQAAAREGLELTKALATDDERRAIKTLLRPVKEASRAATPRARQSQAECTRRSFGCVRVIRLSDSTEVGTAM